MKKQREHLELPEGDFFSYVSIYDHADVQTLHKLYSEWRNICGTLSALQARSVNLPEGLSEIAFCVAKNVWRLTSPINGANTSFDCYDPSAGRNYNRIQVKACSKIPDLTSFGPRSEWDRIYFVDFYRDGSWDGTFDIYELNTHDVYNQPVNTHQSVSDQKEEGRRPRFSIYKKLIEPGKYLSKETYAINPNSIVKI